MKQILNFPSKPIFKKNTLKRFNDCLTFSFVSLQAHLFFIIHCILDCFLFITTKRIFRIKGSMDDVNCQVLSLSSRVAYIIMIAFSNYLNFSLLLELQRRIKKLNTARQ